MIARHDESFTGKGGVLDFCKGDHRPLFPGQTRDQFTYQMPGARSRAAAARRASPNRNGAVCPLPVLHRKGDAACCLARGQRTGRGQAGGQAMDQWKRGHGRKPAGAAWARLLPAALALCLPVAAPAWANDGAGDGAGDGAEERAGDTGGGDRTIDFRENDRRMNAAIARARRGLPGFLAVLAAPAGTSDLSFKYPLAGHEHIWVDRVVRRGESLVGRLANDPAEPGYRLGQRVSVPIADISDWGYRDARGVMQGHFTTRVMLPHLAPADARAIRNDFGW